MKLGRRLIFFVTLLSRGALFLWAEGLLAPRDGYQGDILTAVVHQLDQKREVQFVLEDKAGRVRSKAPGYPLDMEQLEGSSYVGLLGLDSVLTAGDYTLKAEIRGTEDSLVWEQDFTLQAWDFNSENIALDKRNTAIRTTLSDERQNQSRRLWALLNRFKEGTISPLGAFLPPIEDKYIQSSWYGDRRVFDYSDGSSSRSVHNGIDLAAPVGTPIFAPLEGLVIMAENRIVTGWTIVIEHVLGVHTLYYHMDKLEVRVGDLVRPGDLLGTVGSSGLSTGPHLHWELRVNATPVDPQRYLDKPLIDKSKIMGIIEENSNKGR